MIKDNGWSIQDHINFLNSLHFDENAEQVLISNDERYKNEDTQELLYFINKCYKRFYGGPKVIHNLALAYKQIINKLPEGLRLLIVCME